MHARNATFVLPALDSPPASVHTSSQAGCRHSLRQASPLTGRLVSDPTDSPRPALITETALEQTEAGMRERTDEEDT